MILKWLFLAGSPAQHAFPVASLESSIIANSVEGGEGVLSPTLTAVGLNHKDERHATATYKYLPDNSKPCISLHNSVKVFVVTGPSRCNHNDYDGLTTDFDCDFDSASPTFRLQVHDQSSGRVRKFKDQLYPDQIKGSR